MKKIESDKVIALITAHIPSVKAIYLFGSQADGSASATSDVDLAFLTPFECITPPLEVYKLKSKIELALRKDVDLVHLNKASTVFQFQITTTGMHLYVKNTHKILEYEALVLSMYQRLQQERKQILNQVIDSGKVYA
jgi:uncharacterized protein